MSFAVFAAEHVGVGFLLALGSYVLGRRLFMRLTCDSPLEEVFFATTTGLGVVAAVVMVLGFAGALHPAPVAGAFILLLAACRPVWKTLATQTREAFREGRWRSTCGWTVVILVALAPMAVLPLYPPTAFDATMYHLPYAKLYVAAGGIVETPYLRNPVFPQYNEMLFTLMLLLHDDLSAQFVQFLMAVLIALGVYGWGRRLKGPRAGCWAAACWLSHPLVLWISGTAYIDTGLTLFLLASVYGFSNWAATRNRTWLILSGVSCGLALGSKYSALFGVGLLGLAVLYHAFRTRAWQPAILFSILVVCVAAPWYVRNVCYTGNPVFPYFPGIFASGSWSPEDMAAHEKMVKTVGGQKSLALFLKLPWNLVYHPDMFSEMIHLARSLLWLLPLALWALIKSPTVRWVAAFAFLSLVFWFLTAQQLRYLLPVLPLLGLATAVGCDDLARRFEPFRPYWVGAVVTLLFCALLLKPAWQFSVVQWRNAGSPPVDAGARERYLAKRLPSFHAYRWLNQTTSGQYTLYAFYNENMVYFCDGTQIGDHYGPGHYLRHQHMLSRPGELWHALRRLDVDYLLIGGVHRLWLPNDPDEKYFVKAWSDQKTHVLKLAK